MTSEGRLADRALVLMAAAFVLLTPPIVAIFDVPALVFGLPVLHVYCFAVWLAAIGLGALLASRLVKVQPDYDQMNRDAGDSATDG